MIEVDVEQHYPAERRLLAAVVTMAVRDACEKPYKESKKCTMHVYAKSAHLFLWTPALDAYLAFLDIEPDFYREKLEKFMDDKSERVINGFSSENRRNFRLNRLLWNDERRLFNVLSNDEEEDSESVPAPAQQKVSTGRTGMPRHNRRGKSTSGRNKTSSRT